jgi:hypothetical protein
METKITMSHGFEHPCDTSKHYTSFPFARQFMFAAGMAKAKSEDTPLRKTPGQM